MTLSGTAAILLYPGVGAALGALYFTLLYRSVRLQTAQAAAIHIVPLHLMRAVAAIAVFRFVAQQGALPVVLALAGFVIVRLVVLRRVGTE